MARIKCMTIHTMTELEEAHGKMDRNCKSSFSLFKYEGSLLRIREYTAARYVVENDENYELIGSYTNRASLQDMVEDISFCGIKLAQE